MTLPAATVEDHVAALPADRAEAFTAALDLVRRNVPAGIEERLEGEMVRWEIPLSVRPKTYNGEPLLVAALANQKRYLSLYLLGLYVLPELGEKLDRAAPTLKRGKSCINFRRYEDLPADALAEVIRGTTVERYLAAVDAAEARRR
jgi:hypothetical protein